MGFLISTLGRSVFGPRPEIVCKKSVWNSGVMELRRRAGGHRESGAFLLGSKSGTRQIKEFIFYDDIDSGALETGIVVIDGRKLGDLWAYCRKTGFTVVADVHVHPSGFSQSASDKSNPIMAELGHIAIILPYYATKSTRPGGIGVYEYIGSRKWKDRSRDQFSPLHIGGWPKWR